METVRSRYLLLNDTVTTISIPSIPSAIVSYSVSESGYYPGRDLTLYTTGIGRLKHEAPISRIVFPSTIILVHEYLDKLA